MNYLGLNFEKINFNLSGTKLNDVGFKYICLKLSKM